MHLIARVSDARWVQDLPNRLGSVIGPGGVQLSGGETQRVCIARALISRYVPPSQLLALG